MEINVLIDDGFEGYLEASWLESIVEKVLVTQEVDAGAELGLVIGGQDRVHQLNLSYLGKDEPTDVLAFAMFPGPSERDPASFIAPPDGVKHLGEVIICYPQAVLQAEEHRHSAKKEIAILIIHGVLHLLGYDHDKPEPEREMRARETEILSHVDSEGGLV